MAAALAVGAGCSLGSEPAAAPLNVLFIAVDDLRPELGCYGHPVVKSPHIDQLAAAGTVFLRAYCQQAVCNPSRASLMTGLRPQTLEVTDLPTHFRDQRPEAVTVAQHFKAQGYYAERIGKIFHTGHGNRDDALSWSVSRNHPSAPRYGPEGDALQKRLRAEARKAAKPGAAPARTNGPPVESPDVDDDDLLDGSVTVGAIKIIEEVKDRPFFVAVGFHNPHLPFVAPKRYWDLYEGIDIPLADHPYAPKGAPAYAVHNSGELRAYHGIPAGGPVSNDTARRLIRGYWAAVSYVDAQIGRLLDALDRLELRERTLVILWGDHGWQLGEHGMWCKHTNYETSAQAPLIISVPGQRPGRSRALVEFVDVFPALADICGLPLPDGLEGLSFKPLLANPDRPWKTAAFNLYPRRIPNVGAGMGHAIRTDRYRLVEWSVPGKNFSEYELYDHASDPGENVNMAADPLHAELVRQLTRQLHAGWRRAIPVETQ